jgi:hypothetical protein
MPDHPHPSVLSIFRERFFGKDRVNDLLEIRVNGAKVEVVNAGCTPTAEVDHIRHKVGCV